MFEPPAIFRLLFCGYKWKPVELRLITQAIRSEIKDPKGNVPEQSKDLIDFMISVYIFIVITFCFLCLPILSH